MHPANAQPPILVTLLGMVMEVNEEQSLNALSPISVTLLGIVMEVKDLQPSKKPVPYVSSPSSTSARSVIFSGSTTEVKFSHLENTPPPITVTLLGIVIEVKEEQSANALFPILFTLFGIVMEVKDLQSANA